MANDPPKVGRQAKGARQAKPARETKAQRQARVLWDGEPPVEVEATSPVTTVRGRGLEGGVDPRFQLWRDSAIILIGVILVVLAGQIFLPNVNGVPTGSASPFPSAVAIGSLVPPVSLAPGETFGPIIDPSLDIDATPTPIPVITLGPTRSPTPTSAPTLKPTPTLKVTPTPKPTQKPTPKPTKTPTPTPTPVVTPAPPNAKFTWSTDLLQVDFTNTSTGETSLSWDFNDPNDPGGSSAQNPTHTYLVPGDYTVTLVVTGPGGMDSVSHTVTVSDTPPG